MGIYEVEIQYLATNIHHRTSLEFEELFDVLAKNKSEALDIGLKRFKSEKLKGLKVNYRDVEIHTSIVCRKATVMSDGLIKGLY